MSGGCVFDFVFVVYGGVFDLLYFGYELVICWVLFCVERVVLVLSYCYVFGKCMGDFELCCCWLVWLVWWIDLWWVYCELIEVGLMFDCLVVYSIDLLEVLVVCSGLVLLWIVLLIGVDNEVELLCFECVVELCWCFGWLVVEEWLLLYSLMICQCLCEGLVVLEVWCLLEVKDELYCYGGECQVG